MNAIVTGAAKGIGREIALALARHDMNVALNFRSHIEDELLEEIKSYGVNCVAIQGDVSSFSDAEALFKQAVSALGSIDVLINNAGITSDNLMIRMSEQQFDDVISVNLKGAFNMIRHVSPHMLKQKKGAIINISSVVGVMGNAGQANYAASKAGLIGLTKSVAKELGSRGITCNAIAPGFIETDMTEKLPVETKQKMIGAIPLNRFGQTSDVAKAVLFLIDATYITGQVIHVDGGMVM